MCNKEVKISIITLTYNCSDVIERTISSLLQQNYAHLERIYIDGGSTDSTVDLIRSRDPCGVIQTEPDDGIYDALNKGLAIASGDVVGVLHADDTFFNESTVSEVAAVFSVFLKVNVVYGDLIYKSSRRGFSLNRYWVGKSKLGTNIRWGWMPPHPTVFMRRDLLSSVGFYNTKFRISGDYEFLVRLFKRSDVCAHYLSKCITIMAYGGASNGGPRKVIRKVYEDYISLKLNGYPFLDRVIAIACKNVRKFGQFEFNAKSAR